MAFHPPPVTDERDGLAAFIGHNQDAIRALVHGLDADGLDAHPSVSDNSLGWLLHHLTTVQRNWLDGVLAAPAALTEEQNAAIYARSEVPPAEGVRGLLVAYDEACAEVLAAVRTVDPDLPVPIPDAPWFPKDIEHWSVRWVWLHLLQEITRHAGHGDIIRESLDGATMYELVAAHDGIEVDFLESWKPTPRPFARGISTVTIAADDVDKARAWYAEVLGIEAYYATPVYVEFRLGPHRDEFGILDRRYSGRHWSPASQGEPGGAVAHLWVADPDAALADLVERGAEVHQPARDFGDGTAGYRGGSVVDPFGNVIGVISRPL